MLSKVSVLMLAASFSSPAFADDFMTAWQVVAISYGKYAAHLQLCAEMPPTDHAFQILDILVEHGIETSKATTILVRQEHDEYDRLKGIECDRESVELYQSMLEGEIKHLKEVAGSGE